jgi:secondary thiamine-phosphate synthase enzyme
MKSYREELWFETATQRAYVNITSQVEAAVRKSGVREGLVLVNAMHITASVYINDDEAGLLQDYDAFLERIAPHAATYRHNETGEDNGDAHIKRQLMGREVVVAITGGKLDFGPWEQIFSGPNRRVEVTRKEPSSRLPRPGKFGNMVFSITPQGLSTFCVGAGGWRC